MSPAATKSIGGGEEGSWGSGDGAIASTKPKTRRGSARCSNSTAERAGEKGASSGEGSGAGDGEHWKTLSRRGTGASSIQHVQQRPAALNLTGSRSSGDGHGFACVRHEPDLPSHDEGAGRPGENHEAKQFQVQWDGRDDPMNPKNLSKGKKWMVVLIVSAGSTCV